MCRTLLLPSLGRSREMDALYGVSKGFQRLQYMECYVNIHGAL